MKTKLLLFIAIFTMALGMQAKKYPEIKFEKTTIDFGTFSMDDPVQKCTFKFKNVGDAKLVITAVHASCGCTVADYNRYLRWLQQDARTFQKEHPSIFQLQGGYGAYLHSGRHDRCTCQQENGKEIIFRNP